MMCSYCYEWTKHPSLYCLLMYHLDDHYGTRDDGKLPAILLLKYVSMNCFLYFAVPDSHAIACIIHNLEESSKYASF